MNEMNLVEPQKLLQASELFKQAVLHHQLGQLPHADHLYRQIIALTPFDVAAVNNLGLISENAVEKLGLFRRAMALKPDFADPILNLAGIYSAIGQHEMAARMFSRCLALSEPNAGLCLQLGSAWQNANQLDRAAHAFLLAGLLDPGSVVVLSNLGCVQALLSLGHVEAEKAQARAATWYRRTLLFIPNLSVANMFLVKDLEDQGRLEEAKIFRARVERPLTTEFLPSPRHKRTVLMICTPSGGNTPFHTLFNPQLNSHLRWHVEYSTEEQMRTLPAFDVAFNAIGNADIAEPAVEPTERFIKMTERPLLNPPDRIMLTRRDLMPKLFADMPDVSVAPVARLSRRQAMRKDLAAQLKKQGLTFPMLVRPFCKQGGHGVTLVENAKELLAIDYSDVDFHYFIGFCDYRSQDGFFRKYRTVFVDRKPFHYHLAISKKWLVHYFSADMLAEPWKREEERRFLEHPEEVLGARAAAAVAAIGERMDMDYAGIDYTVLQDGRVFIFEANATMSVYYSDPTDYPYRTAPVQAIIDSFEAMLEQRSRLPAKRFRKK